jgi:zinc-binding alcohol dehydrogenase/oxidoreductase
VTSSSTDKIDAARALGAWGGVDHASSDWVNDARSLTPGGQGFDVVLDPVGRWEEAIRALRPGGRCVVLGATAAPQATLEIRRFYFGQYDLLGTAMGSPADMAGLLELVEREQVRPPVVDSVFGLSEASAAHERLESGACFGKIVLQHV